MPVSAPAKCASEIEPASAGATVSTAPVYLYRWVTNRGLAQRWMRRSGSIRRFAGGAVSGECNLVVLDAGDVLHDAFTAVQVSMRKVKSVRIFTAIRPAPVIREKSQFRAQHDSLSLSPRS